MHKTNIRTVASALLNQTLATRKKNPVGFNLATWFGTAETDRGSHNCGTVACIAGQTTLMLSPRVKSNAGIERRARALLKLTVDQASALFTPNALHGVAYRGGITPKQAALVMFNLAETGKVDWKAVI